MALNFGSEGLLSSFLDYLSVECGVSPNTLAAYRNDLKRFFQTCPDHPTQITSNDILAFLKEEREKGLSSPTLARRLASIKSFFKFLCAEGICDPNPSTVLEAPKLWQKLPSVLSIEEVEKVLRKPSRSQKLGIRDRALLELLYATGAQIGRASCRERV